MLTSKSCSEEGLEYATTILLDLSLCPAPAKNTVLKLLLMGAAALGQTVATHINALLEDLKKQSKKSMTEGGPSSAVNKGVVRDRFTQQCVVLTSESSQRSNAGFSGVEYQLASMTALTNKASSQSFFLRILKVIIQLRDNEARRKKTKTTNTSNAAAVVSAAAVIEQQINENAEQPVEPMELSEGDLLTADDAQQIIYNEDSTSKSDDEKKSAEDKMETNDVDEDDLQLVSLSRELDLTELWTALSSCLDELGESTDSHAVLVLQPAVEAFFLVHATASDSADASKVRFLFSNSTFFFFSKIVRFLFSNSTFLFFQIAHFRFQIVRFYFQIVRFYFFK